MNNNSLTPYDEFVIGKNKEVVDFDERKEETVKNERASDESVTFSPAYRKYIQKQLRRTKPSEQKVMTQEEFASRKVRTTFIAREEENAANEGETSVKSVRFKKFGKFLLCGYVIIMLALTLIVVVKTTTVDNTTSADASDANVDNTGKIERMQDEESGGSGDWFDSFCDSLK